MALWDTYTDNVEPVCKILHLPTTRWMIDKVSRQPKSSTKSEECLAFAVYHFATYSMKDEDFSRTSSSSRDASMRTYRSATRHALVNASFLQTAEMCVLQALVLHLIPCRYIKDTHTYWILTGVASRISQRIGLYQDGEKLGLSAFDVHMRRRLFFQVLSMDGIASRAAATSINIASWDVHPPLNIDDNQVWPEMTNLPDVRAGATEMIFCLARSCIGRASIQVDKALKRDTNSSEVDSMIT